MHEPIPLEKVLSHLQSNSPPHRYQAVQMLVQAKYTDANQELFEAYLTPFQDKQIKDAMASALQQLDGLPVVLKELGAEEEDRQLAAANLLISFKDPSTIGALRKAQHDAPYKVKVRILEALRLIGGPEAFDAMMESFHVSGDALQREFEQVFLSEDIEKEVVIPRLLEALSQTEERTAVKRAAKILGLYQYEAALPAIKEAIEAHKERLHWTLEALLRATGEIGGPDAIPILCDALMHRSHRITELVSEYLGQSGATEAIQPLKDAITHKTSDEDIFSLSKALMQLGEEEYACQQLEKLIAAPYEGEDNPKYDIIKYLFGIATPRALQAACSLFTLHEEWTYKEHPATFYRGVVIESITELEHDKAVQMIPFLRTVLFSHHEESHVLEKVTQTLGHIPHQETIHILQEALANEDIPLGCTAREHMLRALINAEKYKAIEQIFVQGSDESKKHIIEGLITARPQEGLSIFLKGLEDDNYWVRWSAVNALKRAPHPEALPVLLSRLYHEDTELTEQGHILGALAPLLGHEVLSHFRNIAGERADLGSVFVSVLISLDTPDIIPFLMRILKHTDNEWSKRDIIKKLCALEHREAIPEMMQALDTLDEGSARTSSIDALADVGAYELLPILEQAYQEGDYYDRMFLLEHFGKLPSELSLRYLREALGGEEELQEAAISHFETFESSQLQPLVPLLLQIVKERRGMLRRHAVKLLGKLEARECIPTLLELADHPESHYIRDLCFNVLGQLGATEALPIARRVALAQKTNAETRAWAMTVVSRLSPLSATAGMLFSVRTALHNLSTGHMLSPYVAFLHVAVDIAKAWHERLLANEKTSSTTISLAGNTEMDAEELAQYGEALIDALTHTSSQLDIFKEDNSNKDDLAMCRTLCEEALSAWRSLCDDARPERWLQLQQDLELALFD